MATIVAALLWTASGVFAVAGMRAIGLAAPGINTRDGYKQEILDLDVRRMQLWLIKTHDVTYNKGKIAAAGISNALNAAIWMLICAPVAALVVSLLLSLFV